MHDGPLEQLVRRRPSGRTPRRRRTSSGRRRARPAAARGWSRRPRSRPRGGARGRRRRRCPCRRRSARRARRAGTGRRPGSRSRPSDAAANSRSSAATCLVPRPRTRRLSAMPSRSMTWRARTLPRPGIDWSRSTTRILPMTSLRLALAQHVGDRGAGVLEPVLDLGTLPTGGGGLLERRLALFGRERRQCHGCRSSFVGRGDVGGQRRQSSHGATPAAIGRARSRWCSALTGSAACCRRRGPAARRPRRPPRCAGRAARRGALDRVRSSSVEPCRRLRRVVRRGVDAGVVERLLEALERVDDDRPSRRGCRRARPRAARGRPAAPRAARRAPRRPATSLSRLCWSSTASQYASSVARCTRAPSGSSSAASAPEAAPPHAERPASSSLPRRTASRSAPGRGRAAAARARSSAARAARPRRRSGAGRRRCRPGRRSPGRGAGR